jgi:hypothetical protein
MDNIIAGCAEFGARRLAWLVGPSSEPADLRARLTDRHFQHNTGYTGLTLNLSAFQPRPMRAELSITEVLDEYMLGIWAALGGELQGTPVRERVGLLR